MKTIAFFDFDGTLTLRDTLVDFTRYAFGSLKFSAGILFISPLAALVLLRLVNRDIAARKFIHFFYKNQALKPLEKKAAAYVEKRVPEIINPEVYTAFCRHQARGHEVVVVSASPFIWLKPWCDMHNAGLLASRMEIAGDTLSGNLQGNRCIGREKVDRINRAYPLSGYDRIYAYGNSNGDIPMLEIADRAFYFNGSALVAYPPEQPGR